MYNKNFEQEVERLVKENVVYQSKTGATGKVRC